MSQFKKTFDGTKLKTNLRLAVNRLKLLEKKKNEMNLKARKEISEYLQGVKYDRARVRVEGVIREDYLVEALEMVEMNCELLIGRIGILETCTNEAPPMDLVETLSNILFAAPRIYQDVQEMVEISKQLQRKFKKDAFAKLQQNCSREANPLLVSRLDIRPPAKSLVESYLVEIAKSFNVDFKPDLLALDGSVDALSSADFQGNGFGGPPPNGGGGGGGGFPANADLINFGAGEQPRPPYPPSSNGVAPSGPGYPAAAQFPQAPPLNPNYPASSAHYQPPFNSHPYPPPSGTVPPNPTASNPHDNPNRASNGMPPSYEESDEKKVPPQDLTSGFPNTQPPNGGVQNWSNVEFDLPQIPDDLAARGANDGRNNDDEGGNGGLPAAGGGGQSSVNDMDDLEARLKRLKGL